MKRISNKNQVLSLPKLILIMVFLFACAPTGSKQVAQQVINTLVSSPVPQIKSTETSSIETRQPSPTPQVTPRGSDLVATDPSTVTLASGSLQLLEFFRFT